ncbi:MAG: hypothetical protein N4A33_03415 [Bacteriovoracaceae bacterium]|jgi:putative N6-adenine-specific DNA methylase|nr:hypothetical protein [Bacteriovoracaceae bacterium]
MEEFFIICPLNLENQVLAELKQKWPLFYTDDLPKYEQVSGGIILHTQMEHGLKLNYILRSANKILLRIKHQKCRDFPKLFKILSKIEWKKYLVKESANFVISSKESKVFNTRKIEDTATSALKKYFNANKIKQKTLDEFKNSKEDNIYLRFENDNLTISYDTTGELLYKRDQISYKGFAPLRNNLAYIMLKELEKNYDATKYALVDPMCGSGTFLNEALNKDRAFTIDSYSFTKIHNIEIPKSSLQDNYQNYYGLDLNEQNIKSINNDTLKLKVQDLFKSYKFDEDCVVITNPPYGKKVKIDMDRKAFFKKVLSSINETYKPKFIGIIIPTDIKVDFKYINRLKVFNNGIWVYFYIL